MANPGNTATEKQRLVQEQLAGRETGQEPGDRQQVGAAAGLRWRIISSSSSWRSASSPPSVSTRLPTAAFAPAADKIQPFKPAARHQIGIVIPGHQVQQSLQ
jgi:hypothetical protein